MLGLQDNAASKNPSARPRRLVDSRKLGLETTLVLRSLLSGESTTERLKLFSRTVEKKKKKLLALLPRGTSREREKKQKRNKLHAFNPRLWLSTSSKIDIKLYCSCVGWSLGNPLKVQLKITATLKSYKQATIKRSNRSRGTGWPVVINVEAAAKRRNALFLKLSVNFWVF